MRDSSGGGSVSDESYGSFVNSLYEKLNRFAELYQEKTSTTRGSMHELPPSKEQVEADSDISSSVAFMLGATSTSGLVDAIAADKELIENLDDVVGSSEASDGLSVSRIETALGYVRHGLDTWEGRDATQFHSYLGSVRLALHRQEVLIEALHALAAVHLRMVDRARCDALNILDHANEALNSYGSWGSGETAGVLTVVGASFGVAAALTTGGAAAGLGIAAVLANGTSSLVGGSRDEAGRCHTYDFDGDSAAIRARAIALISDLKSELGMKYHDLRVAVGNLRDIINGEGTDIDSDDLLPHLPDVHEYSDPDQFRLPVYVSAEP